MPSRLPPRPHLDHLRRQAKALLADLASGKPQAVATFRDHLPAARRMSAAEIARTPFRLADAQSAVARQSGFAAWPHLARHVELLRALEGTWTFDHLTVDGVEVPGDTLRTSRVLIDGDRFRTESPEAVYEGAFNLDVEAQPHGIDIEFVEGPEAGASNFGILRLDGDRLELCLDLQGRARPTAFLSAKGSRCAHEVLRRVQRTRPDQVSGGVPSPRTAAPSAPEAAFPYVASPTLDRLQGEWSALRIVRDGVPLPTAMLRGASRSNEGNEVRVVVGGMLAVHALVRLDESTDPMGVDYQNIGGPATGTVQLGSFRWEGEDACFCIAPPGAPRPDAFEAPRGSGRTLSLWRRGPSPRAGS